MGVDLSHADLSLHACVVPNGLAFSPIGDEKKKLKIVDTRIIELIKTIQNPSILVYPLDQPF